MLYACLHVLPNCLCQRLFLANWHAQLRFTVIMGCRKKYCALLIVLVSLVVHVAAVPLTDLFPFGLKFGDDSLAPGDESSATVTLQQQFPFYGKSRHSVTASFTFILQYLFAFSLTSFGFYCTI